VPHLVCGLCEWLKGSWAGDEIVEVEVVKAFCASMEIGDGAGRECRKAKLFTICSRVLHGPQQVVAVHESRHYRLWFTMNRVVVK
jgi:hypothetical protein